MEDLQDIIGNISHEQDPLSMSLKAVISKLKKRNKLRLWIQQNGAGQLQQSTKRSELGGLQMTVSEYDKQKQELWKRKIQKNRNQALSNPHLPFGIHEFQAQLL